MGCKAVILHSGGMDSTVCLLKAMEAGRDVLSVGVDYGQRHAIELEYAARQCRDLNVPRRVVRVEWDKPERPIPTSRTIEEIRGGVSSAFLPGRNALFLALACAEATGVGASEVWMGANAVDYSGYPDCRAEFVEAFRKMIRLAIPNGPEIVTPLIAMSKPDIAREAQRLDLGKSDTWSCYRPVTSGDAERPCGACDACVLNEYAWETVHSALVKGSRGIGQSSVK